MNNEQRDKYLTEKVFGEKYGKHLEYYYNERPWEYFGKLWNVCQEKEWWSSFKDTKGFSEDQVHPDRFADAIEKFLKERENDNQDKNRIVAEWLDLITFFNKADGRWWYRPIDGDANLPIPDYYNSPNNEAFSLLDSLAPDYYVVLENVSRDWRCAIKPRKGAMLNVTEAFSPSKSIAIVNALIALIEKEK